MEKIKKENNCVIFYLSFQGKQIAETLRGILNKADVFLLNQEKLKENWFPNKLLIFIMSAGIVVRKIAKLISEKTKDPGVIVIDETGRYVIPLLGGHSAFANEIAKKIADFLSGIPVITTASDNLGLPALDIWIKRTGLKIKNPSFLPGVMAKFNRKKELLVKVEKGIELPFPVFFKEVKNLNDADVVITYFDKKRNDALVLVAPCLWIGIGLHQGVSSEEIKQALHEIFKEKGLTFLAIKGIATMDTKVEHPALKELADELGVVLKGVSRELLSRVKAFSPSEKVFSAVGVESVSEQSALFCAGKNADLLVPKKIFKDFTIAIAREVYRVCGKLYIVGTGPGGIQDMTLRALSALREADTVVGYKRYIELISELTTGKEVFSFSMTEEIKRAEKAISLAESGRVVALVSGGDPGIYGMAGLVLEILSKRKKIPEFEIKIIPGVSAMCACSALAGAPLMTDFAVISLSDRLIPWEEIEKRLEAFASTDVPVVIYNPKSRKRKHHLKKAKEIFLKYRKKDTPCAVVSNAGREKEKVILTTLSEMDLQEVHMGTTIIVGNSVSYCTGNWIITPRGYHKKYAF